jgi:hypothetical protein
MKLAHTLQSYQDIIMRDKDYDPEQPLWKNTLRAVVRLTL